MTERPLPLHLTVAPTPGGAMLARCAICGPVGAYWTRAAARKAARGHARGKRHREDAAAVAHAGARAYRAGA